MNALVSIITPTFNSSNFIAETILSVQNQTYLNWEMIIVDDGSTDTTDEIILSLIENDKRIKFYKLNQNSGPAVARNTGIEKASGEYIAFVDSDDLWKPNKIEKQLRFMLDNNVPFSFSFYELIDENGNQLNKIVTTPLILSYKKLYYCNWIGNLTGIYSVDYFGKIPISSIRKRQDWLLWLQIVKQLKVVYPIHESLAYYRIRKDSISASKLHLLKYNYKVYKVYHNRKTFFALVDLFRFLCIQLFIKPKFIKSTL